MDYLRPSADDSDVDARSAADSEPTSTPKSNTVSTQSPSEVSRRDFFAFAAALAALTSGAEVDIEAFTSTANAPTSTAGSTAHKKEWHQLGLLGGLYLVFLRDWLRNSNLYDTEDPPLPPATSTVPPEYLHARTLDGTWNDLKYPTMGSADRRFGRNVPLTAAFPDSSLMDPNPRTVSAKLMTRSTFKQATSINVLAAAWIQFQVHDWFSHEDDDAHQHVISIPTGDSWTHGPITFQKTLPDGTSTTPCTRPPAYKNKVPHWWDGSQLYGSSKKVNDAVRTFKGGRIKVQPNGLLEIDGQGKEVTGFMPNGWIGISLLHGLFAMEHNAICAMLAQKHPQWSDDDLYHKARLIVAALLAKIHTLDWTLAALDTKLLKVAMHTNWEGLTGALQEFSKKLQDSELLGGIVGSPTDHHTAPYAMTEEFVTVYRMHPLMPDAFPFYSATDGTEFDRLQLPDVAGANGPKVLEKYKERIADLFYSLGVTNPGSITIQNYPRHLQEMKRSETEYVDLAAIEIVRDRERGIPRYNAFRRLLGKAPLKDFTELTSDTTLQKTLEDVYGTVDRIDTMVGLLTETPPERFAFSETAFRIFILMASRRLKSDRFYTQPFWSEDTYTKEGLRWIKKNTMATVLLRHFPELRHRLHKHDNAFRPWRRARALA